MVGAAVWVDRGRLRASDSEVESTPLISWASRAVRRSRPPVEEVAVVVPWPRALLSSWPWLCAATAAAAVVALTHATQAMAADSPEAGRSGVGAVVSSVAGSA